MPKKRQRDVLCLPLRMRTTRLMFKLGIPKQEEKTVRPEVHINGRALLKFSLHLICRLDAEALTRWLASAVSWQSVSQSKISVPYCVANPFVGRLLGCCYAIWLPSTISFFLGFSALGFCLGHASSGLLDVGRIDLFQ